MVVSNIFHVHPYLGKIPILTNIFSDGLKFITSSIHFHPLPARLGDLETTVISLAMEGQFRFQVPAIAFFVGTTKGGEMGFLEVEVQLSHHGNMEDGVRNGWMKAIWKPLCIYVLLVIIVFYLYIVVIVCWNTGNTLFWYAPYCDSSDLNVCGQMRIDVKVWVRQFCTKGGGIHTDAALPCGNDPATGRSRSCRGKSGVSLESGLLLFFFVDSSSFMISS